jgi:hypothetical protein
MSFETKDSGKRAEYDSGMVRDTEDGKARFDLLFPIGVPFSEQMLTRFAQLMERGAVKYSERNWERARGEEELRRYRSSALRHLIQWLTGETDEDHAAAVMFNILAGETVAYKMLRDARDEDELEPYTGPIPSDPASYAVPSMIFRDMTDVLVGKPLGGHEFGPGEDYEGREAPSRDDGPEYC